MIQSKFLLSIFFALICLVRNNVAFVINHTRNHQLSALSTRFQSISSISKSQKRTILSSSPGDESSPTPTLETFREAEIVGLRFMQEGKHEQALEGEYFYCL
jgi:hypothetical protein